MLKELFNHEEAWWRRAIFAAALCRIDAGQTKALEFLAKELQDDTQPVEIPGGYIRTVDDIGFHQSESHCEFAAERLAEIGTNAKPAAPALVNALNTTNDEAWLAWASASNKFCPRRKNRTCQNLEKDSNPRTNK